MTLLSIGGTSRFSGATQNMATEYAINKLEVSSANLVHQLEDLAFAVAQMGDSEGAQAFIETAVRLEKSLKAALSEHQVRMNVQAQRN